MCFCSGISLTQRPTASALIDMGERFKKCQSSSQSKFEVIGFNGIGLAIAACRVEAVNQGAKVLDVGLTGAVLRRRMLMRRIASPDLRGSFSRDATGWVCWNNQLIFRPLEKRSMRDGCGERLLGGARP